MNDTTAPSEPNQPQGVTLHAPITIYNNVPSPPSMPDGQSTPWTALKVVCAVAAGLVVVGFLLGTIASGGAVVLNL